MITIHIPETELYDSNANEFYTVKDQVLTLEHSLVSLSKWESKWHKAFVDNEKKKSEETLDYIKCMTVSPKTVDPHVYYAIPPAELKRVQEYIDDPMTGTTFSSNEPGAKAGNKNKKITSEEIYYQMVAYGVPFECEKWHLNRLLTLLRICGIKNNPQKKMGKGAIMSQNRALNEARRKALHTTG